MDVTVTATDAPDPATEPVSVLAAPTPLTRDPRGTRAIQTLQSFIQGAFSDYSEPSAARLVMGLLSFVVSGILIGLFYHLAHVSDVPQLSLWLASMPILIASLIALMVAPYTINRGAAAVASVINRAQSKS